MTLIARALLAGTAFATGAPFPVYVGIWYATDLAGDLYTWFLAVRELRRRGLLEGIRPTLKPTSLPGAWKFAIHINLAISVSTVWGPIARLVVGGLLGPAGAAFSASPRPSPIARKSQPTSSARLSIPRSSAWTCRPRSRGG